MDPTKYKLNKPKPWVKYQDQCKHEWEYVDDRDNGDWCEEIYDCKLCGERQYRELPD